VVFDSFEIHWWFEITLLEATEGGTRS